MSLRILFYDMYGSIRIEEINTVNTVQDRYLNYDGKVKMTITQELKTWDEISMRSKHRWKTYLFSQLVQEYISDDDWRFENHDRTDKIDFETRAEILQNGGRRATHIGSKKIERSWEKSKMMISKFEDFCS